MKMIDSYTVFDAYQLHNHQDYVLCAIVSRVNVKVDVNAEKLFCQCEADELKCHNIGGTNVEVEFKDVEESI